MQSSNGDDPEATNAAEGTPRSTGAGRPVWCSPTLAPQGRGQRASASRKVAVKYLARQGWRTGSAHPSKTRTAGYADQACARDVPAGRSRFYRKPDVEWEAILGPRFRGLVWKGSRLGGRRRAQGNGNTARGDGPSGGPRPATVGRTGARGAHHAARQLRRAVGNSSGAELIHFPRIRRSSGPVPPYVRRPGDRQGASDRTRASRLAAQLGETGWRRAAGQGKAPALPGIGRHGATVDGGRAAQQWLPGACSASRTKWTQ